MARRRVACGSRGFHTYVVALSAAAVLAACGGGGGEDDTPASQSYGIETLLPAVAKAVGGEDTVHPTVPATHYVVTVDTQAGLEALPEHSMHHEVELDDSLLVDLWIDEESLPVRLEYSGTGASEQVRVDYTSWGTPIAVIAPEGATLQGSEAS